MGKFTEDDFLECDKTRVILEEEHMATFELNCAPKITDLYNYYRENMQGLCATPLYYDVHNEFTSHLKAIVYENIVKKYDLNIFYNNLNLAKPLIAKLNADVVKTKKKTAKFDISKTFDDTTEKAMAQDLEKKTLIQWNYGTNTAAIMPPPTLSTHISMPVLNL